MPLNPADRRLTDDELEKLFADPPVIPERAVPAYMFDEGADQRSGERIHTLGTYVTSVQQQGLTGYPSDFAVLAHARRMGCTLVVSDEGFALIHRRLMRLDLNHAGIVFVRVGIPPERVLAFVEDMHRRSVEKEVTNLLYNQYLAVR